MSIQEEARTKARTKIVSALEEKTAIYLKQSWPMVRLAASKLTPPRLLPNDPTDGIQFPPNISAEEKERLRGEEWLRLAREVIDKRQITVAGMVQPITVAELEPQLDQKLRESLNVKSFGMLIPTRMQVNAVADTVGNSVASQTGTGIGFLDGLLGGASFGDLFRGLFNWIASGFKDGFTGLKTAIAEKTGGRMRDAVVPALTALRQQSIGTPNDMSGFLKPDSIALVGEELSKAPAAMLKNSTEQASWKNIRNTKLGDIDGTLRDTVEGELRNTFFNAIGTGFKGKKEFSDLYRTDDGLWNRAGEYVDRAREAVGLPSEQTLKRNALNQVQFEVAKRLAKISIDPNYVYNPAPGTRVDGLRSVEGMPLRNMDTDTQAAVMAYEARQVIKALGARSGVANPEFYALLAVTLPDELAEGIKKNERDPKKTKIPWWMGGNISATIMRGENPELGRDAAAEAAAAPALTEDLSKMLTARLMRDGNYTPDGEKLNKLAGAPLEQKHFTAIAAALSPEMVGMLTPEGRQEIMVSTKGPYEAAA
ncbi:MAG: hypothetical protein K2Q01_10090, partial [Rickettsiales bacterium]|nr:hypothetical protein [Rickettsiales bacterium]